MNPKSQNYNCIILDDEKNCVEVLAYEIRKVKPDLNIVATFTASEDAIDFLADNTIDIIFLDVEMPRLNAFQFLEKLQQLPKNIIFTTAFDNYAIRAFRYYAIDYLLKPIDRNLLAEAIERAYKNQGRIERQFLSEIHHKIHSPNAIFTKIAVPIEHGFQMVNITEIVRCEADSNYSLIYLLGKNPVLISKPLKFLDELLSNHGFFRVHQSHLINLNYLETYTRTEGGQVLLADNQSISVSKSRKKEFERFLSDYKS